MNLDEKVRSGKKAEHLLHDPTMIDILNDMTVFWQSEIQNSKATEVERREECYRMLKCVEQFDKTLKKRIATGKLAEDTLKEKVLKRITRKEY